MSRLVIVLGSLIFIFSILLSCFGSIDGVETLETSAYAGSGNVWVALHRENVTIEFHLLNSRGESLQYFSIPREVQGLTIQIPYMTVDQEGNLFILKQYANPATGIPIEGRMALSVYTGGFFERLLGNVTTVELNMVTDDNIEISRYLHIRADSEISLTGVSRDGTRLIRRVYDRAALISGDILIRTERRYSTATGRDMFGQPTYEPVFEAIAVGVNTVFLSKTGRLFVSAEYEPQAFLLYPPPTEEHQQLYTLAIYPVRGHAHYRDVIFERWSSVSDNIAWRVLTIPDNPSIPAVESHHSQEPAENIRNITDLQSRFFTLVRFVGSALGAIVVSIVLALLIFLAQEFRFKMPLGHRLSLLLPLGILIILAIFIIWWNLQLFLWLLLVPPLWLILEGINPITWIKQRERLVTKVLCIGIPVITIAVVSAGTVVYINYRNVLIETQDIHAQSAGELLRTLLAASIDEFDVTDPTPLMYGSSELEDLRGAMGRLGLYISSVFYGYENNRLLTGIDNRLPYFLPLRMRNLGRENEEMFLRTALMAEQQKGIITDSLGSRRIYITPVATARGESVFLLETGIFQREIDRQINAFLLQLIPMGFITILLSAYLLRLASIWALNHFSEFVKDIEKETGPIDNIKYQKINDELHHIIKKYNDVKRDLIIAQKKIESILASYRRFVPDRLMEILNTDRDKVRLGNGTLNEEYFVLSVELVIDENFGSGVDEKLVNDFLRIIHNSATSNMFVIPDGANLTKLRVLLKAENGDDALEMVRNVFEREGGLDRDGMRLSFFLHKAQLMLRICGNENRYILAMISGDFDAALAMSYDLRRKCSSIVVSHEVYNHLSKVTEYRHRLAGWIQVRDRELKLYDYYEFSNSDSVKIKFAKTNEDFKMGLELFRIAQNKNDYIRAHNIFIRICNENKDDKLAEYYRQLCIKELPLEFRMGDKV
ncbi:MAG: hypothetical protein FWC91_10970 [Defluviitaleaceae bacterium]|nr:hypothetical protein [Defluviitaleaceae bacterium]